MKVLIKNPDDFTELTIKKGFSLLGLAQEIGCSRSHIFNVVRYRKTVSPSIAKKICDVLNVEFDDLFFLTNMSAKSVQEKGNQIYESTK